MERLTLPEMSRRSKVSESSCRRYVRDFSEYIPGHKSGRIALYDHSGVEVIKQIKKLYDQGLSSEQIRENLTDNYPQVVEHDHHELPQATGEPTVKDLMLEIARAIKTAPGSDNLHFILARLDHIEKRLDRLEKRESWVKRFFK
jgi:DNA-binding transcriptional MerR regulator